MHFNQIQSQSESNGQLLNVQDPDDYLMEKYSTLLQQDKEQYEFCKQYLRHFQLKKQIEIMENQVQDIKQHLRLETTITTPKKAPMSQQKSVKQQQNSQSNQNTNRHKRIRRTANQINRHFTCPVQTWFFKSAHQVKALAFGKKL